MRRFSTAVLLVAFSGFTTQSMDLHVHAATEHGRHAHGPALHHHDAHVRFPFNETRITDVDPDGTAIPVRMGAAPVSVLKPLVAVSVRIATVQAPARMIVAGMAVVPRAHGPPSTRLQSLRAPPLSTPL